MHPITAKFVGIEMAHIHTQGTEIPHRGDIDNTFIQKGKYDTQR